MKKTIMAIGMGIIVLLSVLSVQVFSLSGKTTGLTTEALKQTVREELGSYIENSYAGANMQGEIIYTDHWIIQYNIPGKGIDNMGEAYSFQSLESFVNELKNKPDVQSYLRQVKTNLESKKQYPAATYGGGDSWDTITVTLSAHTGVDYTFSYSSNTKLSFAMSVGLSGGDESQYTILELRVYQGSTLDHRVLERVFHFENTVGIPGHGLSLMGYGTAFHMMVTNDDPVSQTFVIYRSIEGIP